MKTPSGGSNAFWNWISKPFSGFPGPKRNLRCLLFLLYALAAGRSFSQDTAKTVARTDTLSVKTVKPYRSPKKAMIFSACLPGLGQAYNRKYWKIPIVYAMLGTTVYIFETNNQFYQQYKKAYIYKTDKDPNTLDLYPAYDATQLQVYVNSYRKYRDLAVMLTALAYALNVADAYVDAQFSNFDVSDNLSMSVLPNLYLSARQKNPSMGLTLSLKF